ncbi:Transcriptional regulatory protein sin3 [Tulasnella sp. 408]|nr:Transcriptional regulatory protein sin3 [Tulasnella sp. 408]
METRASRKRKAQLAAEAQAKNVEDAKTDSADHPLNLGSQSEAPPPSGGYRPLNVRDALSFLEIARKDLQERPDVYDQFLDIMKDFKNLTIDTLGVMERVSALFKGRAVLLQGFNTFLPIGYHLECSSDGTSVKIVTPPETSTTAPSPPSQSVWFEEQPVVYDQFLGLIEDYKNETLSTTAFVGQVSALFRGRRALMVGLKIFLPQGYTVERSAPGSGGGKSLPVTPENEDMEVDLDINVSPALPRAPVSKPLSQSSGSSLSGIDLLRFHNP